jgi:hypothetical protein
MERPKDQRPARIHTTGNYSHWIRRRTATPEATFFVFLFHSLRFHPFTMNEIRALPLEAIKEEAEGRGRRIENPPQSKPDFLH